MSHCEFQWKGKLLSVWKWLVVNTLMVMAVFYFSSSSVAQDSNWIDEPEDIAAQLSREVEQFYLNVSHRGFVPRIFTGVTADGTQKMVMLSPPPLREKTIREFLIWLCRSEKFVAYAYGTLVVVGEADSFGEEIAISASSVRFDGDVYLPLARHVGDPITFGKAKRWWAEADRGMWQPYAGLQRTKEKIQDGSEFAIIWSKLEESGRVQRRQRIGLAQTDELVELKQLGFNFPSKIDGFVRAAISNNELENPGLGYTIAYRGDQAGQEATVYVYDLGVQRIPDGPSDASVSQAFEQAVSDVLATEGQLDRTKVVLIDRPVTATQTGNARYLSAEFLFQMADASTQRSYLYLTGARSRFLKVRVTLPANDQPITAQNFADALASVVLGN